MSDYRCGHDINNKTYVSGHGDLDRPFGNTESDDEGLNIVVAKDHETIVNGDMGYDCTDANEKEFNNKDKNKELLNTSCCSAQHDGDISTAEDEQFVEKAKLNKTGLMVALALGLHNFPEGLITFVGTLVDPQIGIALCVAITVHNIPEGLCVAIPIQYATGDRLKGFMQCFISGIAEPIGAGLGFIFIQQIGSAAYGIIFGSVAGMMIYICFAELIPTALRHDPENHQVTKFLILGMFVMALSLVLFTL